MTVSRQLVWEFWLMQNSDASNFTSELFRLILKADPYNKNRISLGYPEHVSLVKEWQECGTESLFYRSYGLDPRTGVFLEDLLIGGNE